MVGVISMSEWLSLCSNKFSLDYCHYAKAMERSPMDQNSPPPPHHPFLSSSYAFPCSTLPCIHLCIATLFTGMLVVVNL